MSPWRAFQQTCGIGAGAVSQAVQAAIGKIPAADGKGRISYFINPLVIKTHLF